MKKDNKDFLAFKALTDFHIEIGCISGVVGGLSALVGESSNDISLRVNSGNTIIFNIKGGNSFIFNLNRKEDCYEAFKVVTDNI